jgi:hypothetical protein
MACAGDHKDFKLGIRKPLEEIKMVGWGSLPSRNMGTMVREIR